MAFFQVSFGGLFHAHPDENWRLQFQGPRPRASTSFLSPELISNALIADLRPKRAEPRGVRQITYVRTWLCDTGAYPPDEWTIQSEGESDE